VVVKNCIFVFVFSFWRQHEHTGLNLTLHPRVPAFSVSIFYSIVVLSRLASIRDNDDEGRKNLNFLNLVKARDTAEHYHSSSHSSETTTTKTTCRAFEKRRTHRPSISSPKHSLVQLLLAYIRGKASRASSTATNQGRFCRPGRYYNSKENK
jgi:hypothetical protein